MKNEEKTRLQKDIVNCIPSFPHGRLILAPRVGKTKLVIDIIKRDKPKSVLWVTNTSKLAKEDIPNEFINWEAKEYLSNFFAVTYSSLNKREGEFDLIVLDEDQYVTPANAVNLLNGTITYNNIISMTGTDSKDSKKQEVYKLLKLDVLYILSIKKAVELKILADYNITVVGVDLSEERNILIKTKNKSFTTSEKANYKYLNKLTNEALDDKRNYRFRVLNRTHAIYNSISKLKVAQYLRNNLKGRNLFFCSNRNQAEKISPNLYHGNTDNLDLTRFEKGEVNELALVEKGGIGYTFKNIDNLIMVQVDSNRNGKSSQKISRTLLSQGNYKANIWMVCLKGTQDFKWIKETLESFEKEKINFVEFKDLKNGIKQGDL